MEKPPNFEELELDICSLLQATQLTAANSEPDWPEPTTQEILNLDSRELAESSSADDEEGEIHAQMPTCVLPDRRVLWRPPLKNSDYIADLAESFGFDVAVAVNMSWDTAAPSVDRPRLALVRKDIVAGYINEGILGEICKDLVAYHRLVQTVKFVVGADTLKHYAAAGMYHDRSPAPSPGEASYRYALSIRTTCGSCCGGNEPKLSHIHRVVVIGLRLVGGCDDALSDDQRDRLYMAAWRMVRRNLRLRRDEPTEPASTWIETLLGQFS